MKRLLGRAAIILQLAVAVPAHALDMPFGADALSNLVREASVIVRTSKIRTVPQVLDSPDPPYSLFYIRFDEVLKGSMARGDEILVGLLDERPERRLPILEDSAAPAFLFLREFGPDDEPGNLPRDRVVYLVVNGPFGLVQAAPAERVEAVISYLAASSQVDQLLSWAERYLASRDAFIQWSAVMELISRNEIVRAQTALINAVLSDDVDVDNKIMAIQALEDADAAQAAGPLRGIAEDIRSAQGLRQSAIGAVGRLPNGQAQLEAWAQSSDPVLATTARAVLADMRR